MLPHDAKIELLKAIREAKMDITPLVRSPSRLRVIKALYEHEDGIHIRAILRTVGCDIRTLYKVLSVLEREGLIISKRLKHRRGRPRVIKFNRDHPKFKAIEALIKTGSIELIEALLRFGREMGR